MSVAALQNFHSLNQMEDERNQSIFIVGAMDVAIQCNSVTNYEDDKTDVFYSPYSSLQLHEENANLPTIETYIQSLNCVQNE